jgi:Zn-dependent protease
MASFRFPTAFVAALGLLAVLIPAAAQQQVRVYGTVSDAITGETLLQAAALIVPLIYAIVFHEVAHGWVARALGDPTAYVLRRLSLNPLRHVDPVGTVVLPGALALAGAPVFGWAKPVPVDQRRLRNPRYGMMLVAAAGPLTNLLLYLVVVNAMISGIVLGYRRYIIACVGSAMATQRPTKRE